MQLNMWRFLDANIYGMIVHMWLQKHMDQLRQTPVEIILEYEQTTFPSQCLQYTVVELKWTEREAPLEEEFSV